MKVAVFWIRALMMICLLAGCAAPTVQPARPVTVRPVKPRVVKPVIPGQEIAGTWRVVNSSARFTIGFTGSNLGDIYITGWDSADGEKFIVAGVEWDGRRLSGAFKMPSTNYTTFSELELVDPDTLKGTYKSADGGGEEVWKRAKAAPPRAKAPPVMRPTAPQ